MNGLLWHTPAILLIALATCGGLTGSAGLAIAAEWSGKCVNRTVQTFRTCEERWCVAWWNVCSLSQLEFRMSSVSGGSEVRLGELPMENWMSHLPCALWDIPLDHLAIPGQPPCDRTLRTMMKLLIIRVLMCVFSIPTIMSQNILINNHPEMSQ